MTGDKCQAAPGWAPDRSRMEGQRRRVEGDAITAGKRMDIYRKLKKKKNEPKSDDVR